MAASVRIHLRAHLATFVFQRITVDLDRCGGVKVECIDTEPSVCGLACDSPLLLSEGRYREQNTQFIWVLPCY